MANNPTEVLLTEYYRYKQIEEYVGHESPPPLSCVISLGTGMITPLTISSKGRANDIIKFFSRTTEQIKNMAMVFIKQITASDGLPVEKVRHWTFSNGVPYFRFSPPLSQKIDLDENRDTFVMQMMWDTEVYMAECADELEELARYLQCLHSTQDPSL
uniref:Uncharacterized protein n=1 Tax=Panagrolaimus davidi TaxID=227884 RepID=A0A914Q726_9BILA